MYVVTDEQQKDLERRFTYHKPGGDQAQRYQALRGYARELALMFCRCVPDCPERAAAITKLEEAVFWANAGIARNETPFEPEPAPALPPGFEPLAIKPEPQTVQVEPPGQPSAQESPLSE